MYTDHPLRTVCRKRGHADEIVALRVKLPNESKTISLYSILCSQDDTPILTRSTTTRHSALAIRVDKYKVLRERAGVASDGCVRVKVGSVPVGAVGRGCG